MAGVMQKRAAAECAGAMSPGVNRCLRFLRTHWNEPIKVADLVAISKLSRRALFTAFLRDTGESPAEALRRIRIERAQQLLRESDWPVELIAEACGFRSLNSFAVAFKRDVGLAPGAYRRLHPQAGWRLGEDSRIVRPLMAPRRG